MKKTTKSLFVTALVLFFSGLLLALGSTLYVKINGIDPFGVTEKPMHIENKTVSLEELVLLSPNSNYANKLSNKEFSKIDFQSYTGNVVIQAADSTSIELIRANTNNLSYEIIGETLTIKEVDPVGFMGVFIDENGYSFKGLRQLFGPGISANSEKTIIINLPFYYQMDSIDIRSNIGDITVNGIDTLSLNITASSGSVTVKNLRNIETKIQAEGSASNFSVFGCIYDSCVLNSKFGEISVEIPSADCQSTVLNAWIGKIYVQSDIAPDLYKANFSTDMGSVTVDKQAYGKEYTSPSGSKNRITAEVFFGKIVMDQLVPSFNVENTEEENTTETEEIPATKPTETAEA